ncbi:MAG: TRAP transporter large permease subunit, partial [Acholeplasmataceae bacterium]
KNINVLKTVDFDGSEQEIPIDVKTYIHSIIPLVIFLVQVFLGFSLTRSVIISIFICPFVSWLRKETRMSFKDILDALSDGFRNTISLGITTASAGIIVGVIALSGLGFSFVSLLGMFSNHSFIALLITAVLCLVVGMGMPAVAAYVIVATLAVPFFVKTGFMPLAIHFFIFFYSAFATITPPVALGTYAAASLAEADMWKSGIQGFKLASVGFIIPFMFAYSNQLLGQVVHLKEMIIILPTAIFGVLLYVSGLQGYLYFYGQIKHLIFRILFVIFGALLILPDTKMNIVILAIVLVFMIFNKIRPRFKKNVDKLN